MSFARSGALLVLLIGSTSMATPLVAQEQSLEIDGSASSARFFVNMRIRMKAEGVLPRVSGKLRGSAAQGWQVSMKVDGRSLRFDGARGMDRITRSDSFLAVDRTGLAWTVAGRPRLPQARNKSLYARGVPKGRPVSARRRRRWFG